MKKASELFEGEHSSIKKTFDNATNVYTCSRCGKEATQHLDTGLHSCLKCVIKVAEVSFFMKELPERKETIKKLMEGWKK